MASRMERIERRLIDTLAQARSEPEAEAPAPLRDQPSEIVFTALRKGSSRRDDTAMPFLGQVGMGGMGMESPGGTSLAWDGATEPAPALPAELRPVPPGAGGSGMEGMGLTGPEAATEGLQAQGPSPIPDPAPAPAPRPVRREEDMQDLLVRG